MASVGTQEKGVCRVWVLAGPFLSLGLFSLAHQYNQLRDFQPVRCFNSDKKCLPWNSEIKMPPWLRLRKEVKKPGVIRKIPWSNRKPHFILAPHLETPSKIQGGRVEEGQIQHDWQKKNHKKTWPASAQILQNNNSANK